MLEVAARIGLDDAVAYVLPRAAERSWYPGRFYDPMHDNEPWLGWSLDAIEAATSDAGYRPQILARQAGERTLSASGAPEGPVCSGGSCASALFRHARIDRHAWSANAAVWWEYVLLARIDSAAKLTMTPHRIVWRRGRGSVEPGHPLGRKAR